MTTPERMSTGTRLGIIVGVTLLIVIIVISIAGYTFEWKWTGLPATENNGPKTLWDWLDLLIIPAVLGFGALWFRKAEADADGLRAERNAQLERDLENQRAQEAALEAYLDRMSNLLLDKGLKESEAGSPVQDLACIRTLSVLRRLDAERRNHTLNFLRDSQLLGKGKDDETLSLLSNAKLAQIDLSGADLSRADLSGADLSGADLSGADLSGANLSGADLSGADLSGANLSGADLSGANLRGMNLSDMNLRRENLSEAILSGADLTNTNLSGMNLRKMNLSEADLTEANLSGADLTDADLSEADLSKAVLYKANLCIANLSGADLSGADLSGTDLDWTDLGGAELKKVRNLSCKELKIAKNWKFSIRDADLACGEPLGYEEDVD